MANILLAYHTTDGHTRKICESLQSEMAGSGQHVVVASLVDGNVDPTRHDVIVIGASIRYGHHNPAVLEFIRAHQTQLESRPSGFFSVNLVARKPDKNTSKTNPYVRKFLAKAGWKPNLVGVFAGNLDYQRYGPVDRRIIQFIMWLTDGPTDTRAKVDYTDWNEVRRYAEGIVALGAEVNHVLHR